MVEFVRQRLEDKLKNEDVVNIRKILEKLKEKCNKQNQAKGKIQFDLAMDQLLQWNKDFIIKAKDNVEELFNACDLDGNGYIEILEYITLLNCLEPNRFTFD